MSITEASFQLFGVTFGATSRRNSNQRHVVSDVKHFHNVGIALDSGRTVASREDGLVPAA